MEASATTFPSLPIFGIDFSLLLKRLPPISSQKWEGVLIIYEEDDRPTRTTMNDKRKDTQYLPGVLSALRP